MTSQLSHVCSFPPPSTPFNAINRPLVPLLPKQTFPWTRSPNSEARILVVFVDVCFVGPSTMFSELVQDTMIQAPPLCFTNIFLLTNHIYAGDHLLRPRCYPRLYTHPQPNLSQQRYPQSYHLLFSHIFLHHLTLPTAPVSSVLGSLCKLSNLFPTVFLPLDHLYPLSPSPSIMAYLT